MRCTQTFQLCLKSHVLGNKSQWVALSASSETQPWEAKGNEGVCLSPASILLPTYKAGVAILASSFEEMTIWFVERIKNYLSKAVLQHGMWEEGGKGQRFSSTSSRLLSNLTFLNLSFFSRSLARFPNVFQPLEVCLRNCPSSTSFSLLP